MIDKKEMLMEFNTQDIVEFLVEDFGVEYDEAMRMFYLSEVFQKLRDPETGLYLESPAYIYELYMNEQKNHGLVQEEI